MNAPQLIVRHYADPCFAYAMRADGGDGACLIEWRTDDDDRELVTSCEGYLAGGVLFAPRDGDGTFGLFDADGLPDPSAGWYDVATGAPAIIDLHGTPIAALR